MGSTRPKASAARSGPVCEVVVMAIRKPSSPCPGSPLLLLRPRKSGARAASMDARRASMRSRTLPCGASGSCGDGRAGAELGLDHLLERVPVLVPVLAGLELAGELVDEHHRHLQLGLAQLDLARQVELGGAAYLVRVIHRLHDEAVDVRADEAEVLLVAERDLGDGDAVRGLQRLLQESERLHAHALGLDVVALLVVDGVDGGDVHEPEDVDGMRSLEREVVEVLRFHHEVLVAGELEAADDLAVLGLHLTGGAPALLLEAGVAGVVELDEADVLALGGDIELHGDGDHPETYRAFPYRTGHVHPRERS